MSEIDYAELDEEVHKVMTGAPKGNADVRKSGIGAEEEGESRRVVRGRYMDMVHPSSDMRPPARSYATGKTVEAPEKWEIETDPTKTDEEFEAEDEPEFGVIEDVNGKAEMEAEEDFVTDPGPLQDLPDDEGEMPIEYEEEAPDANNYSLGGKSPFIMDAKVEKRPLGDYVAEGNERGVRSTKNVYSQRTPVTEGAPEVEPIVIETPKRKSGWIWALVTLLVIAAGGGLGILAYILYTNQ